MRDNRDILDKLKWLSTDMEDMEVPGDWLLPVNEAHSIIVRMREETERLRAALRGVLEEAAKVAEDNEPEPSKEEMDDSYDAVAAYRVGRWEAAGDIATAIRALKEGK